MIRFSIFTTKFLLIMSLSQNKKIKINEVINGSVKYGSYLNTLNIELCCLCFFFLYWFFPLYLFTCLNVSACILMIYKWSKIRAWYAFWLNINERDMTLGFSNFPWNFVQKKVKQCCEPNHCKQVQLGILRGAVSLPSPSPPRPPNEVEG